MDAKFETINHNTDKPEHRKGFASMEDAITYLQTPGKVAVTETYFSVDGLTQGPRTKSYLRTIVKLFSFDHDFNKDTNFDWDLPEDVIIIQDNTPIATPIVRIGSIGL